MGWRAALRGQCPASLRGGRGQTARERSKLVAEVTEFLPQKRACPDGYRSPPLTCLGCSQFFPSKGASSSATRSHSTLIPLAGPSGMRRMHLPPPHSSLFCRPFFKLNYSCSLHSGRFSKVVIHAKDDLPQQQLGFEHIHSEAQALSPPR